MVCLWSCSPTPEWDTTIPLLSGFRFDGAARENPTVLLFQVDVRDSDGDLGGGTLEPLINGRTTGDTPLSMRELMRMNGLAPDAQSGRLELSLEVQLAPGEPPPAGSRFDVGVRVTDGSGHQSNTPTVTLEISY